MINICYSQITTWLTRYWEMFDSRDKILNSNWLAHRCGSSRFPFDLDDVGCNILICIPFMNYWVESSVQEIKEKLENIQINKIAKNDAEGYAFSQRYFWLVSLDDSSASSWSSLSSFLFTSGRTPDRISSSHALVTTFISSFPAKASVNAVIGSHKWRSTWW